MQMYCQNQECSKLREASAGKFCSECGVELTVQAAEKLSPSEIGKQISGPSMGDVGLIKGGIHTEDNSQHVHYHGVDPSNNRATKDGDQCACCGTLLKDLYFGCKECKKINCLDCRDEVTQLCRDCTRNAASLRTKRIATGFENVRYPNDRVSLQMINEAGNDLNICLLANQQVTFGRRRSTNDIVLRHWPESEENSKQTNKISRTHGSLRFTPGGAIWENEPHPSCVEGTDVGGHSTAAGERLTLRTGTTISPAKVLTMRCDQFPLDAAVADQAYTLLEDSLDGPPSAPVVGSIRSVRLRREDSLAGQEEYIVFQQSIKIGSAPGCEICLIDKSVGPIHARIFNLSGCFWIEPCQSEYTVRAGGNWVPQNHLVPLLPDMIVTLGEIELAVLPFQQYFLDVMPTQR